MQRIDYSGKDKKISDIFCEEYPLLGYSFFRKLLRNSDIKINGKRIRDDVVVHNGEEIVLYIKDEDLVFSPKVLYEDNNIVAYFKSKKIPSQGKGSLEELIKRYVNEKYVLCHRLDTNTDGILLFAKNERVFEEIKRVFRKKEIDKYYVAEVYGNLQEKGTYRDYIVKDASNSRVFIYKDNVEKSQEAILEYVPFAHTDSTTQVEIHLITGRTHQIRAQMAYHGHFVIGDGKYGKEEINRLFKKKTQQLTAYRLVFHIREGFLSYLNGLEIKIQ